MQIWYMIPEDHQRLHALLNEAEKDTSEAHARTEDLQHELLAHLDGEERGLYAIVERYIGFKAPVAELRGNDEHIRSLCKSLSTSAPEHRAHALDELKVAFAEHMEKQSHLIHVAQRKVSHHDAEHMKHEFEAGKHSRLEAADVEKSHAAHLQRPSAEAAAPIVEERSLDALLGLARREHAAVSICEAAIDRLESPGHRSFVGELTEGHLHRAAELEEIVCATRPDAHASGRFESALGRTKIFFAAWLGDKAILKQVRSLEKSLRGGYEQILQAERAPTVRATLQRYLEAARRQETEAESAVETDEAFHQLHSRLPT